jgi:hypothetical protein
MSLCVLCDGSRYFFTPEAFVMAPQVEVEVIVSPRQKRCLVEGASAEFEGFTATNQAGEMTYGVGQRIKRRIWACNNRAALVLGLYERGQKRSG